MQRDARGLCIVLFFHIGVVAVYPPLAWRFAPLSRGGLLPPNTCNLPITNR